MTYLPSKNTVLSEKASGAKGPLAATSRVVFPKSQIGFVGIAGEDSILAAIQQPQSIEQPVLDDEVKPERCWRMRWDSR
ncbi:hypothetical protein OAG56_00960 [Mariniblastus sp.]|jgi:hypothetical protein|nr:hypothetical protein [Mariniblastus sp.]MDB4755912.1 hypothetical protein [Mariniblastus sp.]